MCYRMLSHNLKNCPLSHSLYFVQILWPCPRPSRARLAMCPCRFVLGLREPGAATARVGALRESTRDSVDFPLDSEFPNYPRCTLYSPLLPHYCRKMYEKRYDTSFLFCQSAPGAARDVVISYLPSLRCRTPDPAAVGDSPGKPWAATRTATT